MAKFDVSEWIQASAESREEMIRAAGGRDLVLTAVMYPLVQMHGDVLKGSKECAAAAIAELGRRLDLAAPPKT